MTDYIVATLPAVDGTRCIVEYPHNVFTVVPVVSWGVQVNSGDGTVKRFTPIDAYGDSIYYCCILSPGADADWTILQIRSRRVFG